MKTTIVPAQVTTVEDKIAGNLNFTQLLLLVTPVFISGALFAFLPPFMNLRGYKIVISVLIAVICMTLAIRIKGKILLLWISIIGQYNLRPRYYLYDKNDMHLRVEPKQKADVAFETAVKVKKTEFNKVEDIPLTELVRLENVVSDPRSKFHFKATKKGGLRVYIQEIK
jgi:hypothetical protein